MMNSQQFNISGSKPDFNVEKIKSQLTLLDSLEERTNFLKEQITQLNTELKKNFNNPVINKKDKLNSISEYLELSCLKNYLSVELSLNSKTDD